MVGTGKCVTFVLLELVVTLCHAFHCISPSGNPVDWYVVYKLPEIPESTNKIIKDGTGYFYLDESTTAWTLSKNAVNGTVNQPIYNTLDPIYKKQTSSPYMYVMYNDEPPTSSTSLTHGHTKGVVAFNTTTGFWLIHSVPKYPNTTANGYNWPSNAYDYGQTFICVTYNMDMMDLIGLQMQYTYPKIYDKLWPADFHAKFPNMEAVLGPRQKHVTTPSYQREELLKSKGQLNIHSFAKAAGFHDDLYAGWLAPRLHDNLATETWQNGRGTLDSNCTSTYKVYNVQDINFNIDGVMFKSTKDHSKWAVSVDKHGYWTCIGDINRQDTQYKRGGGTLCLSNFGIWKAFSGLVRDYETCGISL